MLNDGLNVWSRIRIERNRNENRVIDGSRVHRNRRGRID